MISDEVYIGRFCTMSISSSITIGKNALISDRVYLGDCNHGYDDKTQPISKQQVRFGGCVVIGEGSWIGIGVAIMAGVNIGRNSVVGANSVVTRDVPDYCIVAGNPAKVIREIQEK